MPRTIVVRIDVPEDHERRPTVQDVFLQVLDLFDLAESDGPAVWALVSVSKQSPLTVVAESRAREPNGILPLAEVDRQLIQFRADLQEFSQGRISPRWQRAKPKKAAESLVRRMSESTTSVQVIVQSPTQGAGLNEQVDITAQTAHDLLSAIDHRNKDDLGPTKPQIGSLIGQLLEVRTHYHRPAIVVRDNRTNATVLCEISQEDRERISATANFDDVWRGRRVLVSGRIYYDSDRTISKVIASSVRIIQAKDVQEADFPVGDFSGGLAPEEYLRRLREGGIA